MTETPTVSHTEEDLIVDIRRRVYLVWRRGEGPGLSTPARDFQVTDVRLDYEWTPTGWASTIGPVSGYPLDAGTGDPVPNVRTRAIRPRDHTPDGWPTWLIALAAEHRPTTRITIQETP